MGSTVSGLLDKWTAINLMIKFPHGSIMHPVCAGFAQFT